MAQATTLCTELLMGWTALPDLSCSSSEERLDRGEAFLLDTLCGLAGLLSCFVDIVGRNDACVTVETQGLPQGPATQRQHSELTACVLALV